MATSPTSAGAVSLNQVIDDEHAEEALLFWMSVEVFRNRNWKAAKFFGMDEPEKPSSPPVPVRRGSKIAGTLVRRPSKEAPPKPSKTKPQDLQIKLDEAAARKMGISLEQLYVIKEADFIFDTFIRTGSEYWTSFDHAILVVVQKRLENPTALTRDVFAEAQAASFSEMADDLLPRFLREVNEAGSSLPGAKELTPEMKRIKDRLALLSKAPLRRKTGVSTALAFTFSIARPAKAASAEKPKDSVADTSAGVEKSASLLRSMSSMKILGSADGSVHALPISRDRLSNGGLRPINDSDINPQLPRPSGLRPRPSGLGVVGEENKRASVPADQKTKSVERLSGSSRPRSSSEHVSNKSLQSERPRSRIVSSGKDARADLDLFVGEGRNARKMSF